MTRRTTLASHRLAQHCLPIIGALLFAVGWVDIARAQAPAPTDKTQLEHESTTVLPAAAGAAQLPRTDAQRHDKERSSFDAAQPLRPPPPRSSRREPLSRFGLQWHEAFEGDCIPLNDFLARPSTDGTLLV